MLADLEKNFEHFKSEIAPFIEVLQECRFSFDYELKKITIHCKDRQHRAAVNEELGIFFLFLPGEHYQIVSDDGTKFHGFSVPLLIDLVNNKKFSHPDPYGKNLYFKF
jgi:hypothetical protein